jgi:hypothetical protein
MTNGQLTDNNNSNVKLTTIDPAFNSIPKNKSAFLIWRIEVSFFIHLKVSNCLFSNSI